MLVGLFTEAVAQTCSIKKVFLKISLNLQENICARVSFSIKLQALWHRCYPVNFANFLRAPFFRTTPGDCNYFDENSSRRIVGMKYLFIISF